MSELNYTKDKKALQKMRSLIDTRKVVMMATNLEQIPFSICPMTLQQMDEQGDLWFFTARNTDHFKDIERDNRVQLIYLDEGNQTYISIYGNATHIVDDQKVEELWNPMLKSWFEGKDDPNLALLNINMENAYYWESSSAKLVSFFEMAKSAVTGNTADMGSKGHVNLQNH